MNVDVEHGLGKLVGVCSHRAFVHLLLKRKVVHGSEREAVLPGVQPI